MEIQKYKVILIDTNHYAGNFERNLCAYLTGQIGECEVGSEIVEEIEESDPIKHLAWWSENIVQTQPDGDDNYIERPVSIEPSLVGRYQTLGIYVEEFPPVEVFDEFKERLKKAFKKHRVFIPSYRTSEYDIKPFELLGFRFIDRVSHIEFGRDFVKIKNTDTKINPYNNSKLTFKM